VGCCRSHDRAQTHAPLQPPLRLHLAPQLPGGQRIRAPQRHGRRPHSLRAPTPDNRHRPRRAGTDRHNDRRWSDKRCPRRYRLAPPQCEDQRRAQLLRSIRQPRALPRWPTSARGEPAFWASESLQSCPVVCTTRQLRKPTGSWLSFANFALTVCERECRRAFSLLVCNGATFRAARCPASVASVPRQTAASRLPCRRRSHLPAPHSGNRDDHSRR
jgi:hypothetical protein